MLQSTTKVTIPAIMYGLNTENISLHVSIKDSHSISAVKISDTSYSPLLFIILLP